MSPRIAGTVLVVLAAGLFGTLSIVSRNSAALGLGTLAFVAWRSGLAALAMAGGLRIAAAAGRATLVPVGSIRGRARAAFLIATLCLTLVNLAIFAAFQRITVALALIIFYSYPAVVTLASVRVHAEPLDRSRAVALALASVGLLLVVLAPSMQAGGLGIEPVGIGLAALAALSQAVYVLVSVRGYASVPSTQAVALLLSGSAVIYVILLFVLGGLGELLQPFRQPLLWPWVLAASIPGAAISTTALLAGIRALGPSRASILMTLEPVIGAALAAVFLGERPLPLQLVGGAAVLAAAVVLQLPAPASREPPGGVRQPT